MTTLKNSPINTSDTGSTDAVNDLSRAENQSIVTYRSTDAESAEIDSDVNKVTESADSPALSPNGRFRRYTFGSTPDSAVANKDTPSRKLPLAPCLLMASIVGLSVLGGYLLGSGSLPRANSPLVLGTVSSSGNAGNSTVGSSTEKRQATLIQSEMTEQLGDLRAELLRLHAVFAHLAKLAELNEGEFDLDSPLLEWEEQSNLDRAGLLKRRVAHMSVSSKTMAHIFNIRRIAYDQKISGKPLIEGAKSSGFGYRTDPITGKRVEHLGQDYSGPVGEPILALADGVVAFSGKNSGYGNLVELQHIDGFRTRYAHNQSNLVKRGERVKKGQPIALLGSTGRSTGPHVHVEVRLDREAIDPSFFLR